jgi:TonB family protein
MDLLVASSFYQRWRICTNATRTPRIPSRTPDGKSNLTKRFCLRLTLESEPSLRRNCLFATSNPGPLQRQRRFLSASLALHASLLAWLLHTPEPQLLQPSSVAHGHGGNSLTKLYWPTSTPDDSAFSSSASAREVYRHQRLGHEKLIWKRTSKLAKLPPAPAPLSPSAAEDNSQSATLSNLGHGTAAGLPYGSLPGGPIYGDEIRPALPVTTSDPVAYPWELPDSEGNVVVEITIDERGEIVRKTVLTSLGAKLDEKVLSALENWHFHPATHNGVAIASKQDAIFHFRARG